MTETLCDSGAVKLKAGKNVSADLTPAQYTLMINQAESDIVMEMRADVVAGYAGYTDSKKKILEDATSSKAALVAINYDMSGYTSRTEAQTMLDLNSEIYSNAIKKLKDKSPYQDFLGVA
jgi:hypothetical protein